MKKYIIDEITLKNSNVSIEEYLTLLSIKNYINYNYTDNLLSSLQDKMFIKILKEEDNPIIVLRDRGEEFLERFAIIYKPIDKKTLDLEFVEQFRNLWKGLKPGAMGSLNSCKEKLQRWMQENPEYSEQDILNAAKAYLDSLDSYTYLQRADYFIFKRDAKGESSRLSAFIDEPRIDENWTTNLR